MVSDSNNTNDNVNVVDFTKALSERYLSYALSTIVSRSLPDVRDGLKPVHRRLLYAMYQLKLDPASGYKKCARVVGDVIGKYHPHGDVAVYETLVRLAQDFSLRYPLIEGQGNFGSVDGDNAAAMRYTESRMTEIASLLMHDLEKDTVDFRHTYDGSDQEPVLLPASFPNLLANGAEGIAVGMATSIPPHNLHELFDALIYLADHPACAIEDLLVYVKGPDFPTGGVIIDDQSVINNLYITGRGNLRVRAKWHVEELGRGLYQVIVTEIPYQTAKSKLIEKIAELINNKKLPLVELVADESAESIRIVIQPKSRLVEANLMMESLFRQTGLEGRVNVNLNVLNSSGIPAVLNLKEILQEFLAHRQEVIQRRLRFELAKIEHRLEVLDGLLVAFLNLDEVIRIVRYEDHPKQVMIKTFELTEIQAEAILNMKLRSLSKLEEVAINQEKEELEAAKAKNLHLLNSDSARIKLIKSEFAALQKRFGFSSQIGARRTEITPQASMTEISTSAFVEREAITILCSKMGWIRALKGHNLDLSTVKYKEGDEEAFVVQSYTTEDILLITSCGKCYTLPAHVISTGKTHGESVRLLIELDSKSDLVSIMVAPAKEDKLLIVSSAGKGFILKAENAIAKTKLGKQILQVSKGEQCIGCWILNGDMVATIGTNRKLLVFAAEEIPEMQKGQGVILQRFKDAKLSDLQIFNKENGFTFKSGKNNRQIESYLEWAGRRGGSGKIPPFGFPRNNKFFAG